MNREQFITQFLLHQPRHKEQDFPLLGKGRPAAVLIPLVDYGNELTVLFTQRALHLKHHPGQISFPGGGLNEGENIFDGAMRETEEEVGIPTGQITTIGALPNFRTISGYCVAPVVGFIEPNYPIAIDENEVSSIFEVPLPFLLNQNNHQVHYAERKGTKQPIYFIPWQDKLIWGATASMLRNLSHLIHSENR